MKAIRYFLFIVMVMMTSNMYCQDISPEKQSENDIQLGLSFSYDANLSSDRIEFDQYSGYNMDYNLVNFTAGLNLQYFMRRNFAFYSGLNYSHRQVDGTYYCANCGDLVPQLPINSLQFLQIPTTVKYYPNKNRSSFFAEFGVMNQFMLDKSKNDILEGNLYSVSAVLGTGVKYSIGHGLTAQFSAKYINNLSEIFEEADYSYRILGFQISVIKPL